MDYTIISLQALPFILPMLVCAIILNVALYTHLNFKHVQIKNISVLAAFLTIPVAVFLVPLISKMAFDFNFTLVSIHVAFATICFIGVLIFSVLTPKRAPTFVQIAGVAAFIFGFYSLLA